MFYHINYASGRSRQKWSPQRSPAVKSVMALYQKIVKIHMIIRNIIYVESFMLYEKVHDSANFGGYTAILCAFLANK